MRNLLLILFLIFATTSPAQSFEWAGSMGGGVLDDGLNVTTDAAGNVYTCGEFYGSGDFNPGSGTTTLTSNGDADIYIQKFGPSGNLIWARSIGGSLDDTPEGIQVDPAGNVIVIGTYRGPVDFNPGSGNFTMTSSNSDNFILKLSSFGTFIWAKKFGSSSYDSIWELALDSSGNIYTCGGFRGAMDIDPGSGVSSVSSSGFGDIFIQKLDNNGNFQWARTMGSTADDQAITLATDPSGSVVVSGYFQGTVDFNAGAGTTNLTSNGDTDVFVTKYSSGGTFLWAKAMGGSLGNDFGLSITTDGSGNVYTAGFYQGTVDFDPGSGTQNLTSNGWDTYIQKLNASGNFQWVRAMGGPSGDYAASVFADNFGGVYLLSKFFGTVDFDPGPGVTNLTSGSSLNGALQKFDSNGLLDWAILLPGDYSLYGRQGTVDENSNIFITGKFQGTKDFDPGTGVYNQTSTGGFDAYILKLGQTPPCVPTGATIAPVVCGSYMAPDSQVYNSSGNYTAIVQNAAGCDSTITINLTVNQASSSTIAPVVCGSYTAPDNQVYISSGNYTAVIPNGNGCDSTITINLTVNQASSSTIAPVVCGSYTAPDNQVYTSSGNYTAVIPNGNGCDSTITINLTVNQASSSTIAPVVCGSYTAPDNQVYTSSGTYSATIQNAAGCDSTITINLTVNQASSSTIAPVVCGSYTAPDNQVYTSSGNYTAVIPNGNGCDSTITINLTVNQATSSTIAPTACDTYTAPDNQVYTSSGTYTATIQNAAGCDSTITINLTIDNLTLAVNQSGDTLIAVETGATYQWLDCNNDNLPIAGATSQSYLPAQTGNYACLITNGACSDTSDCYAVTIVGIESGELAANWELYPVPAHDWVRILSPEGVGEYNWSLISINGSILKNGITTQKETQLDLGELSPGLYFIRFESELGTRTQRILVQ